MMKKYKIKKFLKDNYGADRYAIIRIGCRYVIAFEDDYGVMFNNGYVEDEKGIYMNADKKKKLIKKTEIPQKDWDDLMKIIDYIIEKGIYDNWCWASETPIPRERFAELGKKYDLQDIEEDNSDIEMTEEEMYKLDPDDMDYEERYQSLKEDYEGYRKDPSYKLCADLISQFYFMKRRKF